LRAFEAGPGGTREQHEGGCVRLAVRKRFGAGELRRRGAQPGKQAV
jgi:hypothetical protein